MTAVGGTPGPGSKSTVKIMANIFISFIGAGVLGLPFAFKEAGVIEGAVIMALVAIISVKAMLLIIDCKYILIQKDCPGAESSASASPLKLILGSHKLTGDDTKALLEDSHIEGSNGINGTIPQVKVKQTEEPHKPEAPGQELTYGDVGYYALGNIGRLLVELSIVLSQVGFCCAYLIFISENMSGFFPHTRMIHWLAILLPPLALLTLLRHLNSLAISSLFAQLSNLLAFAVVFWFDLEHLAHIEIHRKKISLDGFPFFLAVAIYCYEGAGMILSLEASVHKEIRSRFKFLFKVTILLVTTLYISFGLCGYLSFGPYTNEIITLNLPTGDGLDFALMVKSCLCLALFFTYPVMMFPVTEILEKKLLPEPCKTWHGNLLRITLVCLTGLVVLAIPNFANLIGFIGATCCTMIAFVLPGIFHLQIYKNYKGKISWSKLAFDVFLIVLGVVGAVVGTVDAMARLHASHANKDVVVTFASPSNFTDSSNITDHLISPVLAAAEPLKNATLVTIDKLSKMSFKGAT